MEKKITITRRKKRNRVLLSLFAWLVLCGVFFAYSIRPIWLLILLLATIIFVILPASLNDYLYIKENQLVFNDTRKDWKKFLRLTHILFKGKDNLYEKKIPIDQIKKARIVYLAPMYGPLNIKNEPLYLKITLKNGKFYDLDFTDTQDLQGILQICDYLVGHGVEVVDELNVLKAIKDGKIISEYVAKRLGNISK